MRTAAGVNRAAVHSRVPGDSELYLAARDGDRAAFANIVERHKGVVYAVALAGTRDRAVAEEVAQETFLVAWRELAALREPERLRAWLAGIARNRVRQSVRHENRAEPRPDIAPAATAPSPEESMADAEDRAELARALESVRALYREPLVLFYQEELTTDEIARVLDITPAAARKRLSRGREAVRDRLEGRLERSMRRARPGAAFTAAVAAAIGGAAAASAGSSLVVAAVIAGAVAVAGGAGYYLASGGPEPVTEMRLAPMVIAADSAVPDRPADPPRELEAAGEEHPELALPTDAGVSPPTRRRARRPDAAPPVDAARRGLTGRIVRFRVSGDAVDITINRGLGDGVQAGWKGYVTDRAGTPVSGGSFTVKRAIDSASYATVALPADELRRAGYVFLDPP